MKNVVGRISIYFSPLYITLYILCIPKVNLDATLL